MFLGLSKQPLNGVCHHFSLLEPICSILHISTSDFLKCKSHQVNFLLKIQLAFIILRIKFISFPSFAFTLQALHQVFIQLPPECPWHTKLLYFAFFIILYEATYLFPYLLFDFPPPPHAHTLECKVLESRDFVLFTAYPIGLYKARHSIQQRLVHQLTFCPFFSLHTYRQEKPH